MSAPPMGVLQRALSRRDTGIKIEQPEAFDQKKILEHITEDDENGEIVVASSPGALSSAIEKSKFLDADEAHPAEKPKEVAPSGDGDADDAESDDEDDAPAQRGIPLARGASHEVGNESKEQLEDVPRWQPNMELSLQDFDADTVRYLAEGAMCQCFIATLPPAVMGLEETALAAAQKEGVVIKTPIEGGPPSSENDLVVESLVLRELSHPNIIPILGGGRTAAGASFIVLEFLGGGTLRTKLDSVGGGLGLKPTLKHAHQLSSALAYMHDEALPGMILMHRDLKPDNIGFTTNGVIKLMDFGLSKVIQRTLRSRSVKYNMTGETGSPRYMPPEVALSRPYNEKADVWSFTIILWEMMTGRLPFAGQNMAMYLNRVCNGGERPLVQHSWPSDFKKVLESGWKAEPDNRSSFREIHTILKSMHDENDKPKAKRGFLGRG